MRYFQPTLSTDAAFSLARRDNTFRLFRVNFMQKFQTKSRKKISYNVWSENSLMIVRRFRVEMTSMKKYYKQKKWTMSSQNQRFQIVMNFSPFLKNEWALLYIYRNEWIFSITRDLYLLKNRTNSVEKENYPLLFNSYESIPIRTLGYPVTAINYEEIFA